MGQATPMSPESVTLPRPLVNRLLTLAQASPEEEICGLISAHAAHPDQIWPIRNIAEERGHLFQMDPAEQIAALRQMRERSEPLFAIYHSHPHAPAIPSARDRALAAYPEALYLIISLNTTGVLEMQGYRLNEAITEKFQPVALEVIED